MDPDVGDVTGLVRYTVYFSGFLYVQGALRDQHSLMLKITKGIH